MGKPRKKIGQKVRVAFRRNRAQPARVKDWKRNLDDDAGHAESPTHESVVAKGALSRHRTVIETGDQEPHAGGIDGRVIAVRGLIADVDDDTRKRVVTRSGRRRRTPSSSGGFAVDIGRRRIRRMRTEGHNVVAHGTSVVVTSRIRGDRASLLGRRRGRGLPSRYRLMRLRPWGAAAPRRWLRSLA